jgi:hypothetical protein
MSALVDDLTLAGSSIILIGQAVQAFSMLIDSAPNRGFTRERALQYYR